MESRQIPYQDTRFFSKIILDYLEQQKSIQPFFHRFPSIENFEDQIAEKSQSYPLENRKILSKAVQDQYKKIDASHLTKTNIHQLALSDTFTITTGHQLNLFSGSLYFLYKIISVINLCKKLKAKYPKQNFIPIYWMASEDHDFEEINYFNFKEHKVSWETTAEGAVGRLSTNGLDKVFEEFSAMLNTSSHANELRDLFKKAYLAHDCLGDASRYLVNALFGEQGLVVVDGDDKALKSLFKPYALTELKEQISFNEVSKTNQRLLEKGYSVQVNPREINLFYVGDGYRERIIKIAGGYKVNNTNLVFQSAEELFLNTDCLEFVSGNALLRPLYQEVILPNLCYIGGGGELAYWMQLKSTFTAFKVSSPILLLRNSALLVTEKQASKIKKLEIDFSELFLPQHHLVSKKVKETSTIHFDFEAKKNQLKSLFQEFEQLALNTDKSFIGAVKAQESKQLKGLKNLEKRLLKAEKIKMKALVVRIKQLQEELFPNQTLQERNRNFSEYYESYGKDFIHVLLKTLDPLNFTFSVVKL